MVQQAAAIIDRLSDIATQIGKSIHIFKSTPAQKAEISSREAIMKAVQSEGISRQATDIMERFHTQTIWELLQKMVVVLHNMGY